MRVRASFFESAPDPQVAPPSRSKVALISRSVSRSPYDHDSIGFSFGIHRNIAISADYCPKAGLTHWQPRYDDTPPSPELPNTPAEPPVTRRKPNLSDQ